MSVVEECTWLCYARKVIAEKSCNGCIYKDDHCEEAKKVYRVNWPFEHIVPLKEVKKKGR